MADFVRKVHEKVHLQTYIHCQRRECHCEQQGECESWCLHNLFFAFGQTHFGEGTSGDPRNPGKQLDTLIGADIAGTPSG